MAIRKIELGWIIASDLKKSEKFFSETLGLKVVERDAQNGWLELQGKDGGMNLGIGQAHPDDAAEGDIGMNAVLTMSVDNLDESIKELKAKGVEFIDEITEIPGEVRMITFTDEDDNMFQLVEDMTGKAATQKGSCSTKSSCC